MTAGFIGSDGGRAGAGKEAIGSAATATTDWRLIGGRTSFTCEGIVSLAFSTGYSFQQ